MNPQIYKSPLAFKLHSHPCFYDIQTWPHPNINYILCKGLKLDYKTSTMFFIFYFYEYAINWL